MKKFVLFLIIALGVTSQLFPIDAGIAVGFEYGNSWGSYTDNNETVESYVISPGITLHSYNFYNNPNIGIFMHGTLLAFPANNGKNYDYYSGMQTGIFIGPIFKFDMNETITFLFGIGTGFSLLGESYSQYVPLLDRNELFFKLSWNLLVGTDLSIRYKLNDRFSFYAGCVFTYDFFCYILFGADAIRNFDAAGMARDFSMFNIRPYISIGWNLYLVS